VFKRRVRNMAGGHAPDADATTAILDDHRGVGLADVERAGILNSDADTAGINFPANVPNVTSAIPECERASIVSLAIFHLGFHPAPPDHCAVLPVGDPDVLYVKGKRG